MRSSLCGIVSGPALGLMVSLAERRKKRKYAGDTCQKREYEARDPVGYHNAEGPFFF